MCHTPIRKYNSYRKANENESTEQTVFTDDNSSILNQNNVPIDCLESYAETPILSKNLTQKSNALKDSNRYNY